MFLIIMYPSKGTIYSFVLLSKRMILVFIIPLGRTFALHFPKTKNVPLTNLDDQVTLNIPDNLPITLSPITLHHSSSLLAADYSTQWIKTKCVYSHC